jgi:hypothetical protein
VLADEEASDAVDSTTAGFWSPTGGFWSATGVFGVESAARSRGGNERVCGGIVFGRLCCHDR